MTYICGTRGYGSLARPPPAGESVNIGSVESDNRRHKWKHTQRYQQQITATLHVFCLFPKHLLWWGCILSQACALKIHNYKLSDFIKTINLCIASKFKIAPGEVLLMIRVRKAVTVNNQLICRCNTRDEPVIFKTYRWHCKTDGSHMCVWVHTKNMDFTDLLLHHTIQKTSKSEWDTFHWR